MVDTPGIRQFQLWDVIAEEVAGGLSRSLAADPSLPISELLAHSRVGLAVKNAVADGRLERAATKAIAILPGRFA